MFKGLVCLHVSPPTSQKLYVFTKRQNGSAVLITVIMYFNKILNAMMEYEYKGSHVYENEIKCLGKIQ